jgi:hypothetical protein
MSPSRAALAVAAGDFVGEGVAFGVGVLVATDVGVGVARGVVVTGGVALGVMNGVVDVDAPEHATTRTKGAARRNARN